MNNPPKHKKNKYNVEEKPYSEVLEDGTPFKLNEQSFPPLTSEKDKIKAIGKGKQKPIGSSRPNLNPHLSNISQHEDTQEKETSEDKEHFYTPLNNPYDFYKFFEGGYSGNQNNEYLLKMKKPESKEVLKNFLT
uniref:Uncharacterized protein n=1 Tax=Meloidogyne javanica TaxID=6303 RepID=A0A915LS76_MELJA